jgi:formamidopyrimidine-DNA glycosylase
VPELPEVETVRRGLNQVTRNQTIEGGEVLLSRTIAYPPSINTLWQDISGLSIANWSRRGKYLLASLTDPQGQGTGYLGVHLRMTGQLLWLKQDTPLSPHTRVRIFFPSEQELRFVDIRTFGKIWWVPPPNKPEDIITTLQTLGVEPLSPEFTVNYLSQKLQKSKSKIKTTLLDQSVIAGIGNIYADEALFESRIHPETLAGALNSQQLANLTKAIITVLERGIAEGGTTLRDFRTVEGTNGNYGGVAWVYGRYQQACRICQTSIERIKLGGRSSHFCPKCQKHLP